jgi:hypothetical protein
LVVTPLVSGCYTYAESSLATLSPGLQARVTLTEDGFGRVVNQAASNGVPVDVLDMSRRGVAGRVTAMDPSNLTVEMRAGGGSVFAAAVPTQAVEEVSVRTFSRKRTIGAVGGGVLLFALVLNGTMGGSTSSNPPPEIENSVVPVTNGFQIGSRVPIGHVIQALSRLASSR